MQEHTYLIHSAKGSEWKDHKYVKKVGDQYYYSNNKTEEVGDKDVKAEESPEVYGKYLASKFKGGKSSGSNKSNNGLKKATGKGKSSNKTNTDKEAKESQKSLPSEVKSSAKKELELTSSDKTKLTKNDDGTYKLEIEYKDGSTRTATYTQGMKLKDKGDKIKHAYQEQFLVHHGILGQKWGVRRYQKKDGSLTSAGKKRIEKMTNNAFYEKGINKHNMFKTADKIIENEGKEQKEEYNRWNKNNENNISYEEYKGNKNLNIEKRKQINKKYCDIFIDNMADAAIKDLKITNTEETKEFIKKTLKKNNAWNFAFDLSTIINNDQTAVRNQNFQDVLNNQMFINNAIQTHQMMFNNL